MESYAQRCRSCFTQLELHLRALTLREVLTQEPLKHLNSILSSEHIEHAIEHIVLRRHAIAKELERLNRVENFARLLEEQRNS